MGGGRVGSQRARGGCNGANFLILVSGEGVKWGMWSLGCVCGVWTERGRPLFTHSATLGLM
jgi:hypothetical protein